VASFAFNNGDAVVDTNVKRVLYRAFDIRDSDAAFERVAATLLPTGESRRWNNAVMELGGTACGKQPRCDQAVPLIGPATSPHRTFRHNRRSRGAAGSFAGGSSAC
jgi:adenine-specific DNA glycosylase